MTNSKPRSKRRDIEKHLPQASFYHYAHMATLPEAAIHTLAIYSVQEELHGVELCDFFSRTLTYYRHMKSVERVEDWRNERGETQLRHREKNSSNEAGPSSSTTRSRTSISSPTAPVAPAPTPIEPEPSSAEPESRPEPSSTLTVSTPHDDAAPATPLDETAPMSPIISPDTLVPSEATAAVPNGFVDSTLPEEAESELHEPVEMQSPVPAEPIHAEKKQKLTSTDAFKAEAQLSSALTLSTPAPCIVPGIASKPTRHPADSTVTIAQDEETNPGKSFDSTAPAGSAPLIQDPVSHQKASTGVLSIKQEEQGVPLEEGISALAPALSLFADSKPGIACDESEPAKSTLKLPEAVELPGSPMDLVIVEEEEWIGPSDDDVICVDHKSPKVTPTEQPEPANIRSEDPEPTTPCGTVELAISAPKQPKEKINRWDVTKPATPGDDVEPGISGPKQPEPLVSKSKEPAPPVSKSKEPEPATDAVESAISGSKQLESIDKPTSQVRGEPPTPRKRSSPADVPDAIDTVTSIPLPPSPPPLVPSLPRPFSRWPSVDAEAPPAKQGRFEDGSDRPTPPYGHGIPGPEWRVEPDWTQLLGAETGPGEFEQGPMVPRHQWSGPNDFGSRLGDRALGPPGFMLNGPGSMVPTPRWQRPNDLDPRHNGAGPNRFGLSGAGRRGRGSRGPDLHWPPNNGQHRPMHGHFPPRIFPRPCSFCDSREHDEVHCSFYVRFDQRHQRRLDRNLCMHCLLPFNDEFCWRPEHRRPCQICGEHSSHEAFCLRIC
ncbi:hypothetical protein PFISCL1PPCAC_11130 [Pristionchus fissidentatus]|uniref:Uncharacterized protein n=1 Tax=Pristionchus fissidentatus TaxID=1538716 RepID=A0AAV5VKE0_9BILA|nr:hypothetical protein PFISCL1PPCAC_11130 [Pristionchus fissidentatus]